MSQDRTTFTGIPRMPALFGQQAGPRQRPESAGPWPSSAGQLTDTWVVVETDPAKLSALLPKNFELAMPHLIAEAISLQGLPWLAGRGYEMLMLSVPVIYRGKESHAGRLEIVTWEDCPDAILSGRDELGWNKVYADRMGRRISEDGKTIFYAASWGGTTFFEMHVALDKLVPRFKDWRKGPLMHYRVLPRTGQWGALEVEQVTGAGFDAVVPALRSCKSGTGGFCFHRSSFQQLPTHCHIVNKLAEISTKRVVDAGSARLKGWSDLSDMRIID